MSKSCPSTEAIVENMLEEWKRSILTYWTLSLLLSKPMYGLEIKNQIESSTQGKMKLGASTIYQLLRRLENRGLLESRWKKNAQGPPRAYYQLTPTGQEVLQRYATEVFSPANPISTALNELTAGILDQIEAGQD